VCIAQLPGPSLGTDTTLGRVGFALDYGLAIRRVVGPVAPGDGDGGGDGGAPAAACAEEEEAECFTADGQMLCAEALSELVRICATEECGGDDGEEEEVSECSDPRMRGRATAWLFVLGGLARFVARKGWRSGSI
jgi:hypothetical protein